MSENITEHDNNDELVNVELDGTTDTDTTAVDSVLAASPDNTDELASEVEDSVSKHPETLPVNQIEIIYQDENKDIHVQDLYDLLVVGPMIDGNDAGEDETHVYTPTGYRITDTVTVEELENLVLVFAGGEEAALTDVLVGRGPMDENGDELELDHAYIDETGELTAA